MFQGRYIRWNPVPQFEGQRMFCEAVHDDAEGFRIWLSTEMSRAVLVVKFAFVLFYASSAGGKRLARVQNADEMSFPHAFWKVDASALVEEFHRQSVGTLESVPIVHYAFLSCSDCVDVLATEPPIFVGRDDA